MISVLKRYPWQWCEESILKRAKKEEGRIVKRLLAIVHVRNDGGLDQSGSSGDEEK